MRAAPTTRVIARTALLLLAALWASGCATEMVSLYSRSYSAPPPLDGRRVAVLPVISLGRDASGAVAAQRTAERVFADRVAETEFASPTATLAALADPARTLSELRARLEPLASAAIVAPDGEPQTLVEKGRLPDPEEGRESPELRLAVGTGLLGDTFPEYVDPAIFAGIDADYVLGSVTVGRYREYRDITALYGILPIASHRTTFGHLPFVVFALYDTATGQRVWESHIGSHVPVAGGNDRLVDPRGAPVLGAAYLLTEDGADPLARALGLHPPHVATGPDEPEPGAPSGEEP